MEKVAEMFPNVRELFVEVRNGEVLEKIYELYPELTLLSVELNDTDLEGLLIGDGHQSVTTMTNKHFTGIPDEVIQVVGELECGCPEIRFPEEARQTGNIACLKSLNTLLLRVPNSVYNIAMLHGISGLKRLQNLVLLPFYNHAEEPVKWCLRCIADNNENFRRLKTLVTSTEIVYKESELAYLIGKFPNLIHKTKQ